MYIHNKYKKYICILCLQYRLHVSEELDYESGEETEDDEEIKSGKDNVILGGKIKNLSEYEIRRIHRIAEIKKRLQKHYATITANEVKSTSHKAIHVRIDFKYTDHNLRLLVASCKKNDHVLVFSELRISHVPVAYMAYLMKKNK